MRSAGTTFSTAIKSSSCLYMNSQSHILITIQASGLTLGSKKCEIAKPEVKFIGHLFGSIRSSTCWPRKGKCHKWPREPETKERLRQIVEIFSFFRDYIPNFAYASDESNVQENNYWPNTIRSARTWCTLYVKVLFVSGSWTIGFCQWC